MARRVKARRYHHGDLRRALVEEGIALLQTGGPTALTVAEAGRRVGVSSAAPYRHFADRTALLKAIAAEANRRLNEALGVAAAGASDPREAFRRTGVAFIRWAAENPALYRLVNDPELLDYTSVPEGAEAPEALKGSLGTFWVELADLVRSGAALPAEHPLIAQLRGRALAQGMATFFVNGIFRAIGIGTAEAERLGRAVTGEDVPASAPRGTREGRQEA